MTTMTRADISARMQELNVASSALNQRYAGEMNLFNAAATLQNAKDMDKAQRRAAELQPDLILLDNHLPGVNGVDALPALRQPCGSEASNRSASPGVRRYERSATL